ncbi:LOW QUALITY PROTEIN: cytochrome b561 and DOMON domain-containing protein At4g17280-like [Setaria italica]|uniref:LOW QUALITY PROTEIN: cytochrome b561 and DOMON domain-containing protein At4g17280-like n=1 Tax=Setaria italica TaxID=4555 RepID=UPI000646ACD3|nr:LOW QUALITY PROTEIN: cytochrome b561 and DOMON domain-containing protein At4g17280-like [Setaria italica]
MGAGAVPALVLALLLLAVAPPPPAHAASVGRCAGESFSANRAYASCSDLPRLGASVHWTYDRASGDLSVAFVAAPAAPGGWVAWGLNPSDDAMPGAQELVLGRFRTRRRQIHGVLNAVSWGVLLPMGAIVARYLKTFRSADPAWFYLHVACQLAGYGVGVSGWATGMNLGRESEGVTYADHRDIGIAVFALGTLQVLALFLRPKKEHKYRAYWNAYHHSVGYAVIVLGVVNIFKGMGILGVEQRWRTAYIAAVCVLAIAAAALEAVTWGVVVRRRKAEGKTFSSSAASNGHLPH